MDYVLMAHGWTCLMLFPLCWAHSRQSPALSYWRWLGVFGLTHGLHAWLEMLVSSTGDSPEFRGARWGLATVSYLCLLEFARRCEVSPRRARAAQWGFLPLLGVVAAGAERGPAGMEVATRAVLGLLGAMAAARALWRPRHADQRGGESPRIPGASAGFVVWGIAEAAAGLHRAGLLGWILPPADQAPWTNWGLSLPQAAGALLTILSLWRRYWNRCQEGYPAAARIDTRPREPLLAAGVAASLLAGGLAAWRVESAEARDSRAQLLQNAALAVSSLDPARIQELPWEGPAARPVQEWLSRVRGQMDRCQAARLTGVEPGRWRTLAESLAPGVAGTGGLDPGGQPEILAAWYQQTPVVVGPVGAEPRARFLVSQPVACLGGAPARQRWVVLNLELRARGCLRKAARARLPVLLLTALVCCVEAGFYATWLRWRLAAQAQGVELERIRRQGVAIARLAGSEIIAAGQFGAGVREITRLAAETLEVERASVWLGPIHEGRIRCADLYLNSRRSHEEGAVLEVRLYPRYFSTLASGWTVNASDTAQTPCLEEFRAGYLAPLGITSLLDAPVYMEGRVAGVVCLEHTGPRREWMEDEFRFAGEIADQVSRALLNARRKETDEALAASEQRFREFVDLLPQVVFETDIQGNLTLVNQAAYHQTGYTPEDLRAGVSVFGICRPSHHSVLRENLARIIQGSSSTGHEYPMRRKNGSVFYGLVHAIGRVQDGNITGFRGIVIDITERKRIEEALRETERRLTQIINFLPDATLIINQERRVVYWNRAMELMTGVPADKMLGQGDLAYSVPFYGQRRPILIDLVFDTDPDVEQRYLGIKRDGDSLVGEAYIPCLGENGAYLWGVARALYDSEGRFVGAIESIRDVSERRRAGDSLRDTHAELARSYESLQGLLRQQEVNIDLAQQILGLVNSRPQRHTALPGNLDLFVTTTFLPCHAAGGDHFFVRNLGRPGQPGRRTVLSLKDQSGHEVGCILRSLVTDLLHNALLHAPGGAPLDAVLSRLNNEICASGLFSEDDFFTSINAEILHDTGQMRFVSTGHPPLLLVRGREVRPLPEPGDLGTNLPVGFSGGQSFTQGQCVLQPGDKLLFYTDGLLDIARRHGEPGLSSQDLADTVRSLAAAHPLCNVSELITRLFEILQPPGGAPPAGDDVAVLGLELEARAGGREDVLHPVSDEHLNQLSRDLYSVIQQEWVRHGIENPDSRLRLVLEEALLNAWKHGNQRVPGKPVTVRRHYGNDASLEITDQGAGFDWRKVLDPTAFENLTKDSGRGLYIIRLVASETLWSNDGRSIHIFFHRKAARDEPSRRQPGPLKLDLWSLEECGPGLSS